MFYEGNLMPVSQIEKWCASQLTNIIDEQSERIAQTQEQIIDIFKFTDLRMKLFGLPLEEQKEIEAHPEDFEEDEAENTVKS